MDEKKYLLDGEPISANDLIDAADGYDYAFDTYWLKSTSAASRILRINGHTVEHNRELNREHD